MAQFFILKKYRHEGLGTKTFRRRPSGAWLSRHSLAVASQKYKSPNPGGRFGTTFQLQNLVQPLELLIST
jgi:hypothetical protein